MLAVRRTTDFLVSAATMTQRYY